MSQTQTGGRLPRQIPFIIANEACERFSFYGMRNILTVFLISSLLNYLPEGDRVGEAKHTFHTFVIGVYFFPLLGGWLADRFFGKYNTVLWFSLIYCAGHACLAVFDHQLEGFYFGLFLIALGSGGIKPLVSSFMGDQFDQSNKHLARLAFDGYYWSVNIGSFLATLFMPVLLKNYGPSVAFGVPGVLMFMATLFFWLGRKRYVYVPPAAPNPDSFMRVVRTALLAKAAGQGRPGLVVAGIGALLAVASFIGGFFGDVIIGFCGALVLLLAFGGVGTAMQLERARGVHPDEAVDGVRGVLRALIVFALITPFYSLFDQKASTWVVQANAMAPVTIDWFGTPFTFLSSQMQALNPLLVMLLIPANNLLLFPLLRRFGIEVSSLARMTSGIALAGVAWIIVGAIQTEMNSGAPVSMAWQIVPYIFLTMGEVLVATTALEFAYSQAPASMKGAIMAFMNLSITVGNLWVLLANASVKNDKVVQAIQSGGYNVIAFQMYFFAGFALLTAFVFSLYARGYKMTDNYRSS